MRKEAPTEDQIAVHKWRSGRDNKYGPSWQLSSIERNTKMILEVWEEDGGRVWVKKNPLVQTCDQHVYTLRKLKVFRDKVVETWWVEDSMC